MTEQKYFVHETSCVDDGGVLGVLFTFVIMVSSSEFPPGLSARMSEAGERLKFDEKGINVLGTLKVVEAARKKASREKSTRLRREYSRTEDSSHCRRSSPTAGFTLWSE